MNRRRAFLFASAGGAVGIMAGSARTLAAAGAGTSAHLWLEFVAARQHRAFLDVGRFAADLAPFRRAENLMASLRESESAASADIGIAFGAHSTALGYLLTQRAWDEFSLVEWLTAQLDERERDAFRARADWGAESAARIEQLRAAGIRILACRQTMRRWAKTLATRAGVDERDVATRLAESLHAGVEPVPAMIAAAVLAQERRLAYVDLG